MSLKYLLFSCVLFLTISLSSYAQPKTDTLLQHILFNNKDPFFQNIIKQPDTFRLQVIYTQINRDSHNVPYFKNYYFNTDTNLYFNPASTVKLPLALLSLEKLNKLHQPGVTKYTTILYDSTFSWQIPLYKDNTSETGLPTLANFIKKAFLISDNDAYNRMYQFVGQETINQNLKAKGYPGTRITRQFMGLSLEENRHTNQVRFLDKNGHLVYLQPAAYNKDSFYFGKIIKVGRAYYNKNDSLVNEPIDFTKVNNVPLEDLQQMLQSTLFPESVSAYRRFNLTNEDYNFLYRYLSQYPSETDYPKYDTATFYDSYVKFYFRNGGHTIPPYIRVFNKVGWAYGFLIDVSYIVDFKHKVEFMLTSTVYANSDAILNDDKYEYETVGWPFLYQLGQTVYQYELKRQRKYPPDLTKFKINYDHRKPGDNRPSIKNVDN